MIHPAPAFANSRRPCPSWAFELVDGSAGRDVHGGFFYCRNLVSVGVSVPEKFLRWVAGDLTSNRMRGLFAEWLLASSLGVATEGASRVEWDAVDIRFRNLKIEVKTSGDSQQWTDDRSPMRFSIEPQARAWDAETNETKRLSPPKRTADVYVFCTHSARNLTNCAVMDVDNWSFLVVQTLVLDEVFGAQKTVSASILGKVGVWVSLTEACRHLEELARDRTEK